MSLPKFPFKVTLPDTPEVRRVLKEMYIDEYSQEFLLAPRQITVLGVCENHKKKLTVIIQHPKYAPADHTFWMWTDFIKKYCHPSTLNDLVKNV